MRGSRDSMRRGTSKGFLALFLGLGMAFAIWAGGAEGAEKLLFRLAWIKTSSDGSVYYYAVERGLFAAEGLDVTVREGQGSATSAKLIAAGDGFLGIADLGTAMKAIIKGLPVKAVFGEFQENPMAVISLASKPIKTPQELLGKNIVSIAAGSYTKMLPALCKKTGIDCGKINLRFTNPPFQKYLIAGQADGFLGYFLDNVPKLEVEGHRTHTMMYSAYGINLLSNGLIAKPDTLKEKGDAVRRFLRVSAKAWKAAKDNPDEVVDAWMKVLGRGKRDLYVQILKNATGVLQTAHSRGKPIGWMAAEDWKSTQDLLASVGELEKTLPIERYYTNDFLSDVR